MFVKIKMLHVCENKESHVCKNKILYSCKYNIILLMRRIILYDD